MQVEDIHNQIAELFKKHRYPWLTAQVNMEGLQNWSIAVAKIMRINVDDFLSKTKELFWSLSHVQLALGYALIARQNCKFPRGVTGTAYDDDVPDMIGIPEMHFWYHISCARECIYRCWERMTVAVSSACYPNDSEKTYFDGLVSKLENNQRYSQISTLRQLKKQVKHWNIAAELRNKLTHSASSPFNATDITGEISSIYGPSGEFLPMLKFTSLDLVQEIENLKNAYVQLHSAIKAALSFVESLSEQDLSQYSVFIEHGQK